MNHLKNATNERHKKAEAMPFNQEMLQGKLSKEAYGAYLLQQQSIFEELERQELPHPGLARKMAIQSDIDDLGDTLDDLMVLDATKSYCNHLNNLSAEDRLAHVYLNYMALLFGGQISKQKIPSKGNMYDFEQPAKLIKSIRALQKDSWAEEANKGFEYHIRILKELELYL